MLTNDATPGIFFSESIKRNLKLYVGKYWKLRQCPMFQVSAKALETFIASNQNYYDKLSDWFDLWQDQKQHIFRAFKSITAPGMNLAGDCSSPVVQHEQIITWVFMMLPYHT